ncbi:hypothetical protein ARMA_0470 [Ardenticatena maritima]|uniref:CARDB domain-containing protein n=1 Tax=Ardenticatena maritima TaxID=872965 RepID=A0A0M9UBR9_9CHLR|nr:hypothetical protein [Ardenticatena maritima]KPL87834.1 hypothetical protein SE16_09790 [Ardenticatena maritima]GAP62047.1 hypothetical protein ARMA_0470 [Ardenticatena maritima]
MNRRRLLWLLLGVVWLLFATPVNAQDPIEVDIQPFFDGHMKLGALHPVRIVLHNQGGTRDVVVSARFVGRAGLVEREVNLPTGAQKAVTLFMPTSSGLLNKATLRVIVRDMASDEVLVRQDVTVTLHTSDVLFVGRVRGAGRGLDFLTSREMQIADVPLASLPEHPAVLHMLDVLIISGVDTSRLSPATQRSLVAWVNRGGVLVLGGGADAAAVLSGLPETLQPVRLNATETVNADDLSILAETTGEQLRLAGDFVFANATPTTGFVQLALADGRPLVVQRRLGYGVIYWLALDPNQAPFDAWAGRETFWTYLLPSSMMTYIQPVFQLNAWAMRSTSNLLALTVPSLGVLGVVLLLYIIFVGPINYLFLRWKQRLEWAWLTIPLFTLVFSVVTYMWGTRLRGTDLWLAEMGVGFLLPNDTLESEGGALFFSPYDDTFTIEAPGDVVFAPLPDGTFDVQPASTASVYTFRFGDRAQAGPIQTRPGAQTVFYVSPPVQSAPVHIETRLTPDIVEIQVTNTGTVPLKHLVLGRGKTITRRSELAPQETWTVQWNVNIFAPSAESTFIWPGGYFVPDSGDDENRRIARDQFVSALLNLPFASNMPPPTFEGELDPFLSLFQAPLGSAIWFGAWLDEPLYNLSVAGNPAKTVGMHLLLARITPAAPNAAYIVPGDIPLWPERPFLALDRCTSWWGMGVANEEMTFSAWLPTPQPGDTILLGKAYLGSSQTRTLEVLNVRTGEWEQVAYESGLVRLPVADYADANGRVRIRVQPNNMCAYPAIGLERTTGAGS